MEPNIKSITYEKHRERRPVMTADVSPVESPESTQDSVRAPIPVAFETLDACIQELIDAIGLLDDRIGFVSSAPCPELNGMASPKIDRGTSEVSNRINANTDRIYGLINRVRRMTDNLEI